MKRKFVKKISTSIIAISICLFSHNFFCHAATGGFSPDVQQTGINKLIEQKISSGKIAGETLRARNLIRKFYESRGFNPAWGNGSSSSDNLNNFIKAINAAAEDGLHPDTYHVRAIESLFAQLKDSNSEKNEIFANIDIISTDAFFILASHLSSGAIDHFTGKQIFVSPFMEEELSGTLEHALKFKRVAETLNELRPKDAAYEALKSALKEYRKIESEGGWGTVSKGNKIEFGSQDPRITEIRARLKVTGELKEKPDGSEDVYDPALKDAVIKFQERHGLEPDGVIGVGTIEAFNIPVKKRIDQIIQSLNATRALSKIRGNKKYVLVNIPEYKLRVFEDGKEALRMNVIVGRVDRKTPRINNSIKYLVFSPKWYVPTTIAVKDKLPEIQKDPKYLKRMGMKVYSKDENGVYEVEPEEIDWSVVSSDNFSYNLIQDPSAGNALGSVKFMFPNRHSVYLHDTPQRSLFKRAARPLSSGCIRIEQPVDLAELLLRENPEWTREKIGAAMKGGAQRFVHLDEPVPVYLVYMSAVADESGNVRIFKDIYNQDKPLGESKK